MKYSPKYFKEKLPDGKCCSTLVKIFYRPISYLVSSVVAQFGINANTISIFSGIVSIVASICFLTRNYVVEIVGAVLANVWLLLDCVDGNLARGVKKQPFGEFVDAVAGYLLVGLLFNCIGFAAYFEGGLIFPKGCVWVVLLGAIASSSDSLMRLEHQKYKNVERDMIDKGIIEVPKESKDIFNNKKNGLRKVVESQLGISGILQLVILFGTIFRALDIILILSFLVYFLPFVAVTLMYTLKVSRYSKVKERKV